MRDADVLATRLAIWIRFMVTPALPLDGAATMPAARRASTDGSKYATQTFPRACNPPSWLFFREFSAPSRDNDTYITFRVE